MRTLCIFDVQQQIIMSDKDIQRLKELAEKKLANGISKEEALRSLQRAGHLDNNGKFTAQYQNLAQAVQNATKQ
ncbi:hypothetical protein [Chitinophaga sancti]|uniref:Uncharacterized protein n=1 Tax=Chitinophaga sancti TaxID=1004 RepID=A0A1K1SYN7_9BACT|nr:hypothetical protein [Chitinophaga sancti]WQD63943.1 hypothetical protein U0033_06005 [Chitinophaga sancti]WQG90432.1 hypothetical protein SR876_02915 [Chitinophaga sancti]SFW89364.1 hypothetical protein SAMN05661012_06416 [Chitinophaga sancti]